jgi:hypothetical protein
MIDGDHIFSGLEVLDLASFIAGPAATASENVFELTRTTRARVL